MHQHWHTSKRAALWEVPISTAGMFGVRVAISGGNYIRQLPHWAAFARGRSTRSRRDRIRWCSTSCPGSSTSGSRTSRDSRCSIVFATTAISSKTQAVLEEYLAKYRFDGIADYFGLAHEPLAARRSALAASRDGRSTPRSHGGGRRADLAGGPHVQRAAEHLVPAPHACSRFARGSASRYKIHFVLVDDAAPTTPGIWLPSNFARVPDCSMVRHPRKSAAWPRRLMTGIRSAPTEIVCSIDCDCSYDPSTLARMIPLIENADMVTASPYHPQGSVRNVPGWRLVLSKTLSRMYSGVLSERIHTFTSCCRVYRKSAVARPRAVHTAAFSASPRCSSRSTGGEDESWNFLRRSSRGFSANRR